MIRGACRLLVSCHKSWNLKVVGFYNCEPGAEVAWRRGPSPDGATSDPLTHFCVLPRRQVQGLRSKFCPDSHLLLTMTVSLTSALAPWSKFRTVIVWFGNRRRRNFASLRTENRTSWSPRFSNGLRSTWPVSRFSL